MGFFPTYREFYQRALVLIGEKDRSIVQNDEHLTHWLFALEGTEGSNHTDKYHWKVVVYPANKKGSFKHEKPFFVSPLYQCFHEAVNYVRELETLAKEDQLGNSFSIAN